MNTHNWIIKGVDGKGWCGDLENSVHRTGSSVVLQSRVEAVDPSSESGVKGLWGGVVCVDLFSGEDGGVRKLFPVSSH